MKPILFVLTLFIFFSCSDPEKSLGITDIETQLKSLSDIQDDLVRVQKTDSLWDTLVSNELIPFTQDTVVLFLYRGEAESVEWNGDFTSWGNNDKFRNEGRRITGTDIWMLKQSFPSDSRLDYKITINESDWILDPNNPHQQWSGFGPNSELRMPDWKPEILTQRIPEAPEGVLSDYIVINSSNLDYSVSYKVYTPFGYEQLENLPVIYFTDGQEYSDDRLGAAVVVLDNLIYQNKIEPVIAVFVNPIDPETETNNRRADQFGVEETYLAFYTDELIPEIETNYKVDASKESRAIMGTSLGGLNSAYFGFSRPDIFGDIAIQAPAFWYREEIYDIVRESDVDSPDIFMSVGTIGDNTNDARRMKTLFEEMELEFTYLETNEGHSWGAWSAQIDNVLIQFYGI
ncbi:MAG: alpha/beta hydrolase-fold protein [Balneolaceae bacterium]